MIELINQYIKSKKILRNNEIVKTLKNDNAVILIRNCTINSRILEKGTMLTTNYEGNDNYVDIYSGYSINTFIGDYHVQQILDCEPQLMGIKINPERIEYTFNIGDKVLYYGSETVVQKRYPFERYKIKNGRRSILTNLDFLRPKYT